MVGWQDFHLRRLTPVNPGISELVQATFLNCIFASTRSISSKFHWGGTQELLFATGKNFWSFNTIDTQFFCQPTFHSVHGSCMTTYYD